MSVSIDDLASSLSSTHVGQEANSIAALQAQLTETLLGATSSLVSSPRLPGTPFPQQPHTMGPCTTPTARTPSSSSIHWDSVNAGLNAGYRTRSSSFSTRGPSGYGDVEDEVMVEELLIPPSLPSTVLETSYTSSLMQWATPCSKTPPMSTSYDPISTAASFSLSPSTSYFTLHDPFYLQAQANAQAYFSENTDITHHGRPSHSSPFIAPAAPQLNGYQLPHPSTSMHNRAASALP